MRYHAAKARPKTTTKRKIQTRKAHRASGQLKPLKAGWNDRFCITESKNNIKVHPFYRQYFDKQPKE